MEEDGGKGAKVVRDVGDVCPSRLDGHRANIVSGGQVSCLAPSGHYMEIDRRY